MKLCGEENLIDMIQVSLVNLHYFILNAPYSIESLATNICLISSEDKFVEVWKRP